MDLTNKEQILNEHINKLLPDIAELRTAIRKAMKVYAFHCRIQEIQRHLSNVEWELSAFPDRHPEYKKRMLDEMVQLSEQIQAIEKHLQSL